MKFEQVLVHGTVKFFEEGLVKKWDLVDYQNNEEPLIFFGFHGKDKVYENHKSYKIIIPTVPTDLPNFRNLKNNEKTILIYDRDLNPDYYIPNEVIVRNEVIPFKDFSTFQPNKLGDKIYYYSGFKEGWGGHWGKDIIDEIQKNIDFEIITTQHLKQKNLFNIKYLKENYYDKTFLNLNLSKENGMTTVQEMSLMGRKTITMRKGPVFYDYKSIINCKNIEEIILNIKNESKKIGTLQSRIDVFTVTDDWLNINYWI